VRIFDDLRGVSGIALIGETKPAVNVGGVTARINETGDGEIDRAYIEYNDILIAPRTAPDARLEAICALIEAMPKTSEFVFRNATPAFAAAAEAAGERLGLQLRSLLRQPTFHFNLAFDSKDNFSASLQSKIRRSMKLYEERGPVRLDFPHGEAQRDVAWTELMRLHAKTWSGRGKSGVFSAPKFLAFHRRLIERYPANTDLVRVLAGDQTIGVLYNFVERDRAYNYQSGFHYEANNQLAPGFVTHALAAEHYRARGLKVYDLLGGDAEYKRRLGVEGATLETLVLERPGFKSKLRKLFSRETPFRDAGKHQT